MKVYSATQFCNELDILDLRLNTLNPVVDYFIVTESDCYWDGTPKPFYLKDNWGRFEKFWGKLIYQMNTDLPSDYVNLTPEMGRNDTEKFILQRVLAGDWWGHEHAPYGRDTFEKESVYIALQNCEADDMLLLSDLDEIADPEAVKFVLDSYDHNDIYNFNLRQFYYYMNVEKDHEELGPTLLSFENFKKVSFCELKMRRRGPTVHHGGWHFSYQGGKDAIKHKIETFSEWYFNTVEVKDNIENSMNSALTSGRDLFGRPTNFVEASILSLPQYVIEHRDDIYKDYLRK